MLRMSSQTESFASFGNFGCFFKQRKLTVSCLLCYRFKTNCYKANETSEFGLQLLYYAGLYASMVISKQEKYQFLIFLLVPYITKLNYSGFHF